LLWYDPRGAQHVVFFPSGAQLVKCPYCGHEELKVVDSRDSDTGEAIRRRRECLSCQKRFTTYERVENIPFYVIKKDGRREDFNRQKMFDGLMTACEKRDVSPSTIEATIDEIESQLRATGKVEIPSREIGQLVMEHLRRIDDVAYVRFASVYREFRDLTEVKKEIDQLLSKQGIK
jgi:transcriptional repressor NrdR